MITIGFCHSGTVETEFVLSLARSWAFDRRRREQLLNPTPIAVAGSGRLYVQRDRMVREFLDGDDEWLMSIDTDHTWADDAIHALAMSADPVDRPIVGGLCFGTGRSGGALFPTILAFDHNGHLNPVLEYPRRRLVACDGTGWAFMLVHRRVLEVMRDRFGEPLPWFVDGEWQDRTLEGDLAFCLRAKHLGFPVHVNTAVQAPHKKPQFLDEDFYDLVTEIQARCE